MFKIGKTAEGMLASVLSAVFLQQEKAEAGISTLEEVIFVTLMDEN